MSAAATPFDAQAMLASLSGTKEVRMAFAQVAGIDMATLTTNADGTVSDEALCAAIGQYGATGPDDTSVHSSQSCILCLLSLQRNTAVHSRHQCTNPRNNKTTQH